MNMTPLDNPENHSDELLPEYDLDYSKAKSNRFASRMSNQKLKVVVLDDDVAQSIYYSAICQRSFEIADWIQTIKLLRWLRYAK